MNWENIQNQTSAGAPGTPGELPAFSGGPNWDTFQNQTSGGLSGASGNIPEFSGSIPGQDGGNGFPGVPGTSGDIPTLGRPTWENFQNQTSGGFPGADGLSWENIQNQTSAGMPGAPSGDLPTLSGGPNWDNIQNQTSGGLSGATGNIPDFSGGIPGQDGGSGFPGGEQWDNIRNQTGNRIEIPGGGNILGSDGFGNFGDMQNQTIPGMNVGTGYFEQMQNQTLPVNGNQGCTSGTEGKGN